MPREPRQEVAGGMFHITARGNNRRQVFVDDADRHVYLDLLKKSVDRRGWICLAYCLMGNHIHLLLKTPETNLGDGMRALQGDYARRLNTKMGDSGHVFGERYHDELLEADSHLWSAIGYIAQNPVKAGLCERPEDWPWSSHARVVAGDPPAWLAHRHLLEYLAAYGGDPERRYAECVRSAGHGLSEPRAL